MRPQREADPRFRSVLAHEFGHFVLHSHLQVPKEDYSGSVVVDVELTTKGKKDLNTPRDWLEWQAKRFAASVLIPRATFTDAVIQVQKEMGINRNRGVVVVSWDESRQRDLRELVGRLSTIYLVSKTSMNITSGTIEYRPRI